MINALVKIALRLLPERIRHRVRAVDDEHKHIALNVATVAIFLMAAKLIVAAKEMVIAWRYGVSSIVDAYLFVFSLMNWPIMVWFSVLSVVLAPLMARIHHNNTKDLPGFRAELLGLTLLLGAALSLLAWLGLPLLLRSAWTGLPAATAKHAIDMAAPLAMLALPGLLVGLLSSWMLAAGRHVNTFLEAIPALVILLAILVTSGPTAEPLIWGTLAGFAFHFASLATPLIRTGDIELPRFRYHSPHWPTFWGGFGMMLTGQALMTFTNVIDQFFAAKLGEGNIATLGYANRLLTLFLALGATVVARATLPVFSRMHATGSTNVRRLTGRWAGMFFLIGVAAMLVGWWFAPWMVRVLFERGAFDTQDSAAVTSILRYGMSQLPVYFSGIVFVSFLSSRGKYLMLAIIGGINLCFKTALSFLLVPPLGLSGLMMAGSGMLTLSTLLMWLLVSRGGHSKLMVGEK